MHVFCKCNRFNEIRFIFFSQRFDNSSLWQGQFDHAPECISNPLFRPCHLNSIQLVLSGTSDEELIEVLANTMLSNNAQQFLTYRTSKLDLMRRVDECKITSTLMHSKNCPIIDLMLGKLKLSFYLSSRAVAPHKSKEFNNTLTKRFFPSLLTLFHFHHTRHVVSYRWKR